MDYNLTEDDYIDAILKIAKYSKIRDKYLAKKKAQEQDKRFKTPLSSCSFEIVKVFGGMHYLRLWDEKGEILLDIKQSRSGWSWDNTTIHRNEKMCAKNSYQLMVDKGYNFREYVWLVMVEEHLKKVNKLNS